MATEDFVSISADDWYQRRREDAVGEFFRKVADQGPRKGQGGGTRQGIYCLTADGKLLAYKNAGQNAEVMRDVLKQALAAWKKLPEEQRKPGALKLENPDIDPRYSRKPPTGAVVVKVYTRILDRDSKGEFCKGSCPTLGGDKTARDHLWLTEADIRSLIPADATVNARFAVPATIAERIARFHLIDNTRGEPPMWQKKEIHRLDMQATVLATSNEHLNLRIDGSALLAAGDDPGQAARGFDVKLLGYVGYDRRKQALGRFDLVAFGEHWGDGTFTRGARKGRTPLGIAFELAGNDAAAAGVPPQAAREIREYLGSRK